MRRTDEHILVITDGSLASLLACLIAESEVGGAEGSASGATRLAVVPWVAPARDRLCHHPAPDEVVRRFVGHQVEALSLGEVIDPGQVWQASGPLSVSHLLLRASEDAMVRGCRRVIWPIALGDDLELVHVASEWALAVSQLAGLDGGVGVDREGPAIETPFLDFTPAMLLDLADDLDAPLGSCWLNPRELALIEVKARRGRPAMPVEAAGLSTLSAG